MDLTIFEFHLPGAQFNAPYSGRGGSAEDESDEAEFGADAEDGTGGDPGPKIAPLVALLALLALALLARHLRKSGDRQSTLAEVED